MEGRDGNAKVARGETLLAHVGKLVVGALLAAGIGSLAGAIASAPMIARPDAPPQIVAGIIALVAVSGSLVGFVSLLVIGIPLTWPFRRAICQRPMTFGAIYALSGAMLGIWVAIFGGLAGRGSLIPAIAIGGGTAAAWIWVMCRNRAWLE